MNKTMYLLVLLLILSIGTEAIGKKQKLEDQKIFNDRIGNFEKVDSKNKYTKEMMQASEVKNSIRNESQSVNNNIFVPDSRGRDGFFINMDRTYANPFTQNTMVTYNPAIGENGKYWFVMNQPGADDDVQFFQFHNLLEFTSTDGENWTLNILDSILTNQTNFLGVHSGAAFRSAAASDPEAHEILFYSSEFLGGLTPEEDQATIGVREFFYTYTTPTSTTKLNNLKDQVETNESGDPQLWTVGDVAITENANNSGGHMMSLLTPDGDNVQYGYYGYTGIAGVALKGDIIPPEWYFNKFYHGEGTTANSSAMTTPAIDVDEFGNLYGASEIRNIVDFDIQDVWIPTVWKSTDEGDTWADTNKCPKSLVDEWALTKQIEDEDATGWIARLRFAGNGVDGAGNSNPRNPFVVTGEDEYSFFRYVVPTRDDGEGGTIGEGHYIIELRHENGIWSINEVAALNEEVGPFANRTFYERSVEVEEKFGLGDNEWGLFTRFNPRIIELEAARDASGENIIVKYIDYRKEDETSQNGQEGSLYALGQEYTVYNYEEDNQGRADTVANPIDSIRMNDIYLAYRPLNGTEWTSYNQSNDDRGYFATRLPKVVESVDNVAVFYKATYADTDIQARADFWNPLKAMPLLLREYVDFAFGIHGLAIAEYNATEPTLGSVKNTEKFTFDIRSINPNPARDKFDVVISTEKPEFITVNLYNMQGTQIAQLYNGMMSANQLKAIPFDASHLGTGQYYVNMNVGSQVVTKIVNVIK